MFVDDNGATSNNYNAQLYPANGSPVLYTDNINSFSNEHWFAVQSNVNVQQQEYSFSSKRLVTDEVTPQLDDLENIEGTKNKEYICLTLL